MDTASESIVEELRGDLDALERSLEMGVTSSGMNLADRFNETLRARVNEAAQSLRRWGQTAVSGASAQMSADLVTALDRCEKRLDKAVDKVIASQKVERESVEKKVRTSVDELRDLVAENADECDEKVKELARLVKKLDTSHFVLRSELTDKLSLLLSREVVELEPCLDDKGGGEESSPPPPSPPPPLASSSPEKPEQVLAKQRLRADEFCRTVNGIS